VNRSGKARVQFFEEIGEIWTVGVYNLVVLALCFKGDADD